jgi:hypothetical protein
MHRLFKVLSILSLLFGARASFLTTRLPAPHPLDVRQVSNVCANINEQFPFPGSSAVAFTVGGSTPTYEVSSILIGCLRYLSLCGGHSDLHWKYRPPKCASSLRRPVKWDFSNFDGSGMRTKTKIVSVFLTWLNLRSTRLQPVKTASTLRTALPPVLTKTHAGFSARTGSHLSRVATRRPAFARHPRLSVTASV